MSLDVTCVNPLAKSSWCIGAVTVYFKSLTAGGAYLVVKLAVPLSSFIPLLLQARADAPQQFPSCHSGLSSLFDIVSLTVSGLF